MVEITDRESAEAYFKTISLELRCLLTSRAALRVVANVGRVDGEGFERLALASFRAILTSAGRGLGRPADVDWLNTAADSAALSAALSALSALSAARSALSAARSAADSAAFSAARSALSALSAADSAAFSAARSALSAALSAAYSALSADTNDPSFAIPVWPSFEDVEHLEEAHAAFIERLDESPVWAWWRRWYEEMWNGTFTDWDFALEVAKIDWDAPEGESVWDKGAAAVAERIEELRRERLPDPPPDLLQRLKSNRAVLALLEAAERENIAEAREKLRGENGIDEETRDRLNQCLDRIEDALREMLEIAGNAVDGDEDWQSRAKDWWNSFSGRSRKLAREYGTAENIAEASVPTALILGCTGIGALFGAPLAGSVVGGLLSNQLKPGQAAKELGRPSE
ncbi:MAG: hypothetical protein AAGH70_14225 [Pseudomonadota bacterium]